MDWRCPKNISATCVARSTRSSPSPNARGRMFFMLIPKASSFRGLLKGCDKKLQLKAYRGFGDSATCKRCCELSWKMTRRTTVVGALEPNLAQLEICIQATLHY